MLSLGICASVSSKARVTRAGARTRLQLSGCSDAQGFNSSSLAVNELLLLCSLFAPVCFSLSFSGMLRRGAEQCCDVVNMLIYSLRGSNPRPMAHKTIALTTELREPWCKGASVDSQKECAP